MTQFKDKVAETAEHVKNAVTETADKVGHVAKEIVVDTAANIKRIGDKTIDKVSGAVHVASDKGKEARDKKKNGSPARKA